MRDSLERIVTLEVEMRHLREELEDTHKKVDEMHAVLMQARGARWLVLTAASLAGALASLLATFGISR